MVLGIFRNGRKVKLFIVNNTTMFNFLKKPEKLSYNEFKDQIYMKLSEENKHELFYYSLFDPSGWEELSLGKSANIEEFSRDIKLQVKSIIRGRANREFFKKRFKGYYKGDKDKLQYFLEGYIYSDKLCKFMIAAELEKRGLKLAGGNLI